MIQINLIKIIFIEWKTAIRIHFFLQIRALTQGSSYPVILLSKYDYMYITPNLIFLNLAFPFQNIEIAWNMFKDVVFTVAFSS